jgi:hypothetical protein
MSEENIQNNGIDRVERANSYLNEDHNLAGQLNWYDNKAGFNKTWHMRLGLIIIVGGAVTAIVQLWSPSPDGVHWSSWLSAALGAVVIIAKGIDSLWKFDENWTNYRQAAEQMKRERRLYINSVGPYQLCSDEDTAFQLFAKRIEQIIATEENTFWKDKPSTDEKLNE